MTALIPIDQITTFDRVRQATRKQVDALVASIGEVGLLNPVTVAPTDAGFALVAGMHRLEACRALGWTAVPAVVLELDEQRRIIAECDENLCAPTLTAAERAEFTRRRKAAYEALHPGARHGGDRKSDQVADSATRSFAEDQAAKTGQAPRTVRQDAERGEKVCDEALGLLKGTKLDTGAYLDRIKNLPAEDQVAKVQADLAEPEAKPQTSPKPAKPVDPERRKLAKWTTDALINEVMGLRSAVAEEKSKAARLKAERDDLAARLAEALAQDGGRTIGNLQRQVQTLKGRMAEHQTAAKKWEFRAKKAEARVKELENTPIEMGAL